MTAELILATLGTVDLCLKYGNILVEKYRVLKNARRDVEEQFLLIETTWFKISQPLKFLERVWGQNIDEDYRCLQERILKVLQAKLEKAVVEASKAERLSRRGDGNAFGRQLAAAAYAFTIKDSLENAVQELQSWQREFDTSWYLILGVADKVIDKELAQQPGTGDPFTVARHLRDAIRPGFEHKNRFLSPEELDQGQRWEIPSSTAQVLRISGAMQRTYILDRTNHPAPSSVQFPMAKDVLDLAAKLERIEPTTFHILKCKGVVQTKDRDTKQPLSYDFIFRIPRQYHSHQPSSLRHHLLHRTKLSLTSKMEFAKQIATAINYIHVLQFVHKNIRPDTIILFDGDDPTQFSPLFLVGFKAVRAADGHSERRGTSTWAENIYQHPARQGTSPRTNYIMQHDIYSLGVCLLEIGLWESFLTQGGQGNPHSAITRFDPGSSAGYGSLKYQFTQMAQELLPERMGGKYTRIVVNCLTCLDETNMDFGDESEFEDDTGVLIGVRYIEKILLQMGEIAV
ncbi:hypothetical protein FE257_012915 [Aspergillus nanangensis]|uniref:Protein kinase domain-containing protein n=1 Tax=Aspergillus nanangensis TaxID=2582783 RepID=A0AAD4GPP8_ASPNN|nr:hypothetical protein FE257_012915 [Aspergillus nanangensis]